MPSTTIKFIIIVFYFVFILFIVAFNVIYLQRAIRGEMFSGLHPPKKIATLVRMSTYVAIFTVFLLLLLMLFRVY